MGAVERVVARGEEKMVTQCLRMDADSWAS